MQNNVIVGIDLGTTNSAVALVREGAPDLLPVQGKPIMPSVVGVSPQNELLVGEAARNQWTVAPDRTVRSIKRRMGSNERVDMAGQQYSPQEISALILQELKDAAEQVLGAPVERAVITVPAYFNEVQRQATIEAGEIAGLVVERIINEPTAAALAYGYGHNGDEHLRVLVYDLGGGTFDVSIIDMNSGIVDVVATAGDNQLGGDDFDERLAALIAEEFEDAHGIDLRQNHQAWARLLRAAEEAKIELSSAAYTDVVLEYIADSSEGTPLHIHREVERAEYEELIEDLLERTMDCIDSALKDANLDADKIDRVLLVGGATRTPMIHELVAKRLGQDPHMEIDPDAAVALGAAVQAGIIAGEEIDAILVDVTPLSLGIAIAEIGMSGRLVTDRYKALIRRNTTIPVQKSEVFSTLMPGQKSIEIKVYQGEQPIASQNTLLGEFMVEDLKPNQFDGLTDVTVNFSLDVNAILNVTVTERHTNKRTSERLKASRQRLSPEEVARSQTKLAAVGNEGRDQERFDPGVAALLERARAALAQPDLDEDLVAQIQETVSQIRAIGAADSEMVEELCDELIDLLFEAEE